MSLVRPSVTVPRLFEGETIVCLGGGPSLTLADVSACRGRARVIAISDAIRLAPWADVLYACDAKWWNAHPETRTYSGPKYGLEQPPDRPDVQVLLNTGTTGLERQPTGLKSGRNSGYQAINLAVHLGARTVVLLGYDMKPAANGAHHWFGRHAFSSVAPPYHVFLEYFATLLVAVRQIGVTVLNATPGSALPYFPIVSLEDALSQAEVVACAH